MTTPSSVPIRKSHLDALAYALLFACCIFWGAQQVLVKATVTEIPPVLQVALRFWGAMVLLWLWCLARGVSLHGTVNDAASGTLPGIFAGLLFAAEFTCIYIGLQHTSASRLTVFLYTAPFWVAGLLPLFVRSERLRAIQWLGLGCAFLAVVFAFWGGMSANASVLGDGLGVAAGMFWGLTTVVIRSTSLAQISAERLLFYQVAVSAMVLPLVSLLLGEEWTFQWSAFAWVSLAVQTVIGAFASYLVWMWLLGRYPVAKMGVFVFLTPVFALLFGNLWLGEPLTASLVLAIGLVVLGILLVNKK